MRITYHRKLWFLLFLLLSCNITLYFINLPCKYVSEIEIFTLSSTQSNTVVALESNGGERYLLLNSYSRRYFNMDWHTSTRVNIFALIVTVLFDKLFAHSFISISNVQLCMSLWFSKVHVTRITQCFVFSIWKNTPLCIYRSVQIHVNKMLTKGMLVV